MRSSKTICTTFYIEEKWYCSRPGQRVEPGLRCKNVKPGQPPVNQGSEAIKPHLDDNVCFQHNAGSTRTRSRGHLRIGDLMPTNANLERIMRIMENEYLIIGAVVRSENSNVPILTFDCW